MSLASIASVRASRLRRLPIAPPHAFAAPAAPWIRRLWIVELPLCTAIACIAAVEDAAAPRIGQLNLIVGVINIVVALTGLGAAVVLFMWRRRPPLALTPRGVQSFLRTATREQLEAKPSLPRRLPSARSGRRRFEDMGADPQFVAAAIEYYRRHPAARPMIGQPDEYQRLSGAIAATDTTRTCHLWTSASTK